MRGAVIGIRTTGGQLYRFMEALRASHLPAAGQYCKDGVFHAQIRAGDYKQVCAIAKTHGMELETEYRKGLRFHFHRVKYRYGLLLGMFLAIFLLAYFSNTVVKVEIYGNEQVSTAQIADSVEAAGIRVGAFIPGIDFRMCELQVRLAVNELSWVGIRHTGGRIVVDVAEGTPKPEMQHTRLPSNFVATEDALLLSVRSYDGMQMKLEGDSVRKDEIIISGVLEDSFGCTTLHHAWGEAIGEFQRTVVFRQPLEEERRIEAPAQQYRLLSLFGHRFPLYLGDIQLETYSYEESETAFSCLGKALPISIVHTAYTPFSYVTQSYTEAEATALLAEQTARYEKNFLGNYEIMSRKETAGTAEGCVSCEVSYVLRGEVGTIREIFIK